MNAQIIHNISASDVSNGLQLQIVMRRKKYWYFQIVDLLKKITVMVEYEYSSSGFSFKSLTFFNLTNFNGKHNPTIAQVFANLINITKTESG